MLDFSVLSKIGLIAQNNKNSFLFAVVVTHVDPLVDVAKRFGVYLSHKYWSGQTL